MADKKISALTAASTPLAGTEVLPIVQSSATVKVATNDLTVRNVRANATTGILQVTGPTAASTRVMTVPDANFTTARTDAAQSFTGDQTLSTGNLIIGTSGKGIDFSITNHPAGMTSELLADYEEGTWTPAYTTSAGAYVSVTHSIQLGKYRKVGSLVYITLSLRTSAADVTAASGQMLISGLPYTAATQSQGIAALTVGYASAYANVRPMSAYIPTGTATMYLTYISNPVGSNWGELNATELSTGNPANILVLSGCYIAA